MRIALLALLVPALASALPADAALVKKDQIVEGIPFETLRAQEAAVRGTYFFTLNYGPNIYEKKPPYRSLVLTIDTEGNAHVYRRFISNAENIVAVDFKPQPDGTYTFALNRPQAQTWIYDMRTLDIATDTEIVEPRSMPVRDPELDGHETVVYHGDERIFLFYRWRKEGGKNFYDMEVQSISARTGQRVGFWASKGLFQPTEDDYLHFNSLFPMPAHQVLASARSTSALYVINLSTGRIDDTIDSKSWKVVDDPLNGFSRQHHAHFRPNGNLVMFDNRDPSEAHARSRAVEYAVDWQKRTLRMVWEQKVEDSIPFRLGWGSVQEVGDKEVVISWGDYPRTKGYCDSRTGNYPLFSHLTREGAKLFELRVPCGWFTYRAYFVPARP